MRRVKDCLTLSFSDPPLGLNPSSEAYTNERPDSAILARSCYLFIFCFDGDF